MKQNRILSGIAAFLPHLLMAYSWIILTCAAINTVNDGMGLLSASTSRHFETVYFVVCVLTAIVAFVQKKCRILAAAACTVGVVMMVPVIIAMARDSHEPLITKSFNLIAAVFGVLTLIFSVALIIMQRKDAPPRAES